MGGARKEGREQTYEYDGKVRGTRSAGPKGAWSLRPRVFHPRWHTLQGGGGGLLGDTADAGLQSSHPREAQFSWEQRGERLGGAGRRVESCRLSVMQNDWGGELKQGFLGAGIGMSAGSSSAHSWEDLELLHSKSESPSSGGFASTPPTPISENGFGLPEVPHPSDWLRNGPWPGGDCSKKLNSWTSVCTLQGAFSVGWTCTQKRGS